MSRKVGESHTQSYSMRLGERGRVVIPAQVRAQLELKEGDRLVLTVEEDRTLRLTPLRLAARRARGLFRDVAPGRNLVDELIAERRDEAARE